MFSYTLFCVCVCGGGGEGGEVWKIKGMTLTKFNTCMAVDQVLQ